ncbi:MAG: hypothetical protein MK312_16315, partial [Roseibacillus sp.]|nr:hypothetical protein [Roseibacillus sp.]
MGSEADSGCFGADKAFLPERGLRPRHHSLFLLSKGTPKHMAKDIREQLRQLLMEKSVRTGEFTPASGQ